MDDIKPITNQGFFSYVFKLSKFKQADLLNFAQYTALSIIPLMLFYFYIKKYTPSITYQSSSFYICIITFIEIILFVVAVFFIDRIVNYIPTLSGKYYDTINLVNISILFVMIILLSQAGYRERTSILLYRFDNWFKLDNYIASLFGFKHVRAFDMFDDEKDQYLYQVAFDNGKAAAKAAGADDAKAIAAGNISAEKLKQKKLAVNEVSNQKIISSSGSNNNQNSSMSSTLNPNMSQQYATPAPLPMQGPVQSQPNYNNMYANTQNPLQNAATPGTSMSTTNPYSGLGGGMDSGDPEPANGALGGSWTSW